MSAISQDLAMIDSAKYGEEVRGSIHHAIEQCYTDVTTAETLANTAANNANTKAGLADAATTRANQAAATAENFTGLVAPTYSTSATYAVGNYVVYNGAMYRCITAIDTAEAWTAAHWTAVSTGAEVTNLKSAIVKQYHDDFEYGSIQITDGVSSNATNRIRNVELLPFDLNAEVFFPSTVKISVRLYAQDGTFIRIASHYIESSDNISHALKGLNIDYSNASFFKIIAMYKSDDDISDLSAFTSDIIIYCKDESIKIDDNEYVKTELYDVVQDALYRDENAIAISTWVQGGISVSSGANYSANNRIRRNGYISSTIYDAIKVHVPTGYKVRVIEFATDDYNTFVRSISGSEWMYSDIVFKIYSDKKYRYVLAKTNDDPLSPTDIPNDFYSCFYSLKTAFKNTEMDLWNIVRKTYNPYQYEYRIGGINYVTGEYDNTNTKRIRFYGYLDVTKKYFIKSLESGIKLCVYFYRYTEETYKYINNGYYNSEINTDELISLQGLLKLFPTCTHCRVTIGYSDDREVTDIDDLASKIEIVQIGLTNYESTIEQQLENVIYDVGGEYYPNDYEIGGIGPSGTKTNVKNRMRLGKNIPIKNIVKIYCDEGYSMVGRLYLDGSIVGVLNPSSVTSFGNNITRKMLNNVNADSINLVIRKGEDLEFDSINESCHVHIIMSKKASNADVHYELGQINNIYGGYADDNTRIRSKELIPKGNEAIIIYDSNTYQASFKAFTNQMTYVSKENWRTNGIIIINALEIDSFYLTFRKLGDPELTESDIKNIEETTRIIIYNKDYDDLFNYGIKLSVPFMNTPIGSNEILAPTLCAVKLKHEQGKHPLPVGFLYNDNVAPYKFYWSQDGTNPTYLFTWNAQITDTGTRTPMEYSIGITYEGDIICVYRGEMAYAMHQTPLRQNPIVYPHGDYEHPVMVDFGNDDPPTSWLQSCGYYAESGRVFACEYTRFTHTYSYVWRITTPYTNKSNWKVVNQFQVSGNQHGFKHCHNIERDPFTGILWLTTGDQPPEEGETYVGGPGIYYSLDNGNSWITLFFNSEKYCRQLNFVWMPDYVYWSSDTGNINNHFFIRAKRNSNGVIDINTMEDLWQFYNGSATYHCCYCTEPNGIICLERYDSSRQVPINIFFWDINNSKMRLLGRLNPIGNARFAFRVVAMNHYPTPNGNEYLMGYGFVPNWIDMPGNKYLSDYTSQGYAKRESDLVGCINNVRLMVVKK